MKKIFTLVCAVIMCAAMAGTAFAATNLMGRNEVSRTGNWSLQQYPDKLGDPTDYYYIYYVTEGESTDVWKYSNKYDVFQKHDMVNIQVVFDLAYMGLDYPPFISFVVQDADGNDISYDYDDGKFMFSADGLRGEMDFTADGYYRAIMPHDERDINNINSLFTMFMMNERTINCALCFDDFQYNFVIDAKGFNECFATYRKIHSERMANSPAARIRTDDYTVIPSRWNGRSAEGDETAFVEGYIMDVSNVNFEYYDLMREYSMSLSRALHDNTFDECKDAAFEEAKKNVLLVPVYKYIAEKQNISYTGPMDLIEKVEEYLIGNIQDIVEETTVVETFVEEFVTEVVYETEVVETEVVETAPAN